MNLASRSALLFACGALAADEASGHRRPEEFFVNSLEGMHPLESIKHITTYEEIPIFGGLELREQMLVEQRAGSSKKSQLEQTLNTLEANFVVAVDKVVSFS